MSEWKHYRKRGTTEMRPYVPGEDLSGVSVNNEDNAEIAQSVDSGGDSGGMVARNSDNYADQWYVAEAYFCQNYEPIS